MDLLPSEVLLKIFRNLSYKDLNSVLLVSRRFKYLAEDPLLWRNFHLQITSKLCNQLDDCLLKIRRLANVSHILVWGYGLNENQIETVFNSLRFVNIILVHHPSNRVQLIQEEEKYQSRQIHLHRPEQHRRGHSQLLSGQPHCCHPRPQLPHSCSN